MRLNMTQQGGLVDEFVSGGGSVLNPLILVGNPTSPLEAATKQYVDTSLMSLNVNNIISGTISSNRFPAMNGDLTSSSGSGNLILSNTGVVSGTYAKVSVNNKGRVTNGMSLIESDIPSLSWNKITLNKPSTLSGYGITDALSVNGSNMIGQLSITGTPTLANQLVNKNYLDSVVGGTTGISVGDIITQIDAITPTGFLKCNGAELEKTSYSDLYNAIGDRYTLNGKAGNGQPWRNQYDINTEDFSGVSTWRAVTSLPGILGGSITFVTKNRIYVFGGYNGSSHVGTGYTALINNDGTLGPWTAATALPGILAYSTSIVTKNKVYLLGGYINNTTATNLTYVADINADGTIGTWGNGPNMPGVTSYNASFVNNNRIYVVGGYNGSAGLTTVFSSTIKEDGSLGTWVTETPLPIAIGLHSLNVIKNRVYIFGGQHNGTYSANIYSAALNSDGSIGTWQLTGTTPVTLGYHCQQSLVTRNFIYIFGGVQNSSHSANIYKAPILADGSIGSWQLVPWTLPATLVYSHITVTKDHIYVIGGQIAGGWSATCWTADITGGLNDYSSFYSNVVEQNYMVPGSGKPWQQQYQINTTQSDDITGWVTDSSALPISIANAQAIVTKNRVYLCGGHNGSVYLSTVYTAPINSDGTLGIWVIAGMTGNSASLSGNSSTVIPASMTNVTIVGKGADGTPAVSDFRNPVTTMYTNPYAVTVPATISISPPATINFSVGGESSGVMYYQGPSIYDPNSAIYVDGSNIYAATYTKYTASSTTGANSTVVINGVTYTFPGGAGAVATEQTFNISLDGVSPVTCTYNIPAGGTCNITYSYGTYLPVNIALAQVIVTKTRAYLIGGYNGTAALTSVYTAPINTDGTLGAWVAAPSLLTAVHQAQAIITQNKVYLLGGRISNDTCVSTVQFANVYPDGTLGTWSAGTALPVTLGSSQVVVTKNRVYLLGGHINATTLTSTIYTASINSDGTLGVWSSAGTLPANLGNTQAFISKNTIYLLGGVNVINTPINTIYKAPINADGIIGSWSTGTSLPGNISRSQLITTNNRVYLCGGNNGSNVISTIYSAPILEGLNDYSSYYAEETTNYTYPGAGRPWESQYHFNTIQAGNITGWTTSATGVMSIATHVAIVTKNRVYVGAGASNIMYTAPINSDGTLGTWTSLGAVLPVSPSYSSAVVTKNRAFIIGSTGTNAILTAPINADGTLGSWSSLTGTPVSFSYTTTFVTNKKLYVLSGSGAGTVVYYANINDDGTLGGWVQSAFAFPISTNSAKALVTKNRVYIMGGSQGGPSTGVWTAAILPDGTVGNWVAGPSLLTGVEAPLIIATKNTVIIGGGYVAYNTMTNVSQIATINADGTIGNWSYGTVFPMAFHSATPIITNGKVHLIGGSIGVAVVNSNIYTANFVGGLNDYSSYFNGDILPVTQFVTTAKFKLPDASFSNDNLNYFIKY